MPHGQGVQTAKTQHPTFRERKSSLFHRSLDLKVTMVWYHTPDCGKWNFPSYCTYFLLILTFRVHWSLPSGRGMSCGNRRGNSNSPSDTKGDCRCRFSGWMLMLSCLATCRWSVQVMDKLNLKMLHGVFRAPKVPRKQFHLLLQEYATHFQSRWTSSTPTKYQRWSILPWLTKSENKYNLMLKLENK